MFFCKPMTEQLVTAIIYFDWYKGSIRTSIILWYTRNLAWRKGHTAGTPEQAWPARPRFGLDFQIHKVEVRYLFLKALILTKGQAWQKSSSAITCDKKLKLYSQVSGSLFAPSQKVKKLSHPFRLCFELGLGIYVHHAKY